MSGPPETLWNPSSCFIVSRSKPARKAEASARTSHPDRSDFGCCTQREGQKAAPIQALAFIDDVRIGELLNFAPTMEDSGMEALRLPTASSEGDGDSLTHDRWEGEQKG